ncbi:MAG: DUF3307 domain-containing protein [Chitinophagales bacterium]
MNLFEALLVGHLVGDFLFQTHWMAENKNTKLWPLFVHSLVYTLTVYAFSWLTGGISYWGMAIIFLSHFLLDQRSFTRWWLDNISKSSGLIWMQFAIDQVFHIVFLTLVVFLNLHGY